MITDESWEIAVDITLFKMLFNTTVTQSSLQCTQQNQLSLKSWKQWSCLYLLYQMDWASINNLCHSASENRPTVQAYGHKLSHVILYKFVFIKAQFKVNYHKERYVFKEQYQTFICNASNNCVCSAMQLTFFLNKRINPYTVSGFKLKNTCNHGHWTDFLVPTLDNEKGC